MRKQELGDYLLWEGELAKIIGMTDRDCVIIELLDHKKCPKCGHDLGPDQIHVVVDSPMYKNGAKPINTIKL